MVSILKTSDMILKRCVLVRRYWLQANNSDKTKIPGVLSIHELHVWRLNQEKALASVHVIISNETISDFVQIAKTMNDCFHGYGVHSATVQPELGLTPISATGSDTNNLDDWSQLCQVKCGTSCEVLTCCG